MTHLTLQQLSSYLDGELPAPSIEAVRRHLSQCAECTRRFGHMEAQEEILVRLLNDDPGDAFFESLLSAVASGEPRAASRQRAEVAPRPEAECDGDPERLIPNMDPPAATPIFTKAGPPAAEPMRLPVESPTLYGRREADRERPAPRRGAAGWIAAAILIVAALSLAVVTTRPRRVAPLPIPKPVEPAPARAPAPATTMATAIDAVAAAPPPAALESAPVPIGEERDRTASVPPPPEAAATGRVPDRMKPIYPPPPPRPRYRTIETAIPDTAKASPPASAPPEPAERGDEAATTSDWRPEFQRATERSRAAARTKSAAAFDEAADAWELVIPRLADEPEEEARARHEVARARYQAWLAGASIARRDAAIHATRAYLLLAPPGPDRDLAWAWLGRLKH